MKKSDTKSKTGNQPLVSIICRSIDRPLLHEALASIAAQSYSPIEVILVDCLAKGIKTSSFADYRLTLKLVSHGKTLGRSAAANAGLDQASGELLMFLDDDDWIAPEHVANLVTALQQDEHCLAVYSSVRAVKFDGTYTDFVFAQEYDPVLLRRDNFIPIHAVLFTRTLLDQGCRFDESLDIYEDWDFWLQVSRQTTLRHIDQVTAFYRQGGSSDTGTDDYSTRFQPGHVLADARAGIYEKWRKHWSGAELNQLLGSMDSTAEMQELNQRLAREHRSYAEAREANQLLRGALEYVKQSVKRKLEQNRELLNLSQQNAARLEQANKDLRVNRWHLERHVEELQGKIDSIYASLGWRLMGPFRRAYRLLEKLLLNPLRAWLHSRDIIL